MHPPAALVAVTRRVLLRVAFDGPRFHGSQRQPDVATVNGAILQALEAAGHLADEHRLRAQGRVDRGVSARDHPVALDVEAPLHELARALAGQADGVVPYAGARVHEGFDPRLAARSRTYRYLVADVETLDLDRLSRTWELFEGTHDWSSFARIRPAERQQDPVRPVTGTRFWRDGPGVVLEATARTFLRHQVRRMVGASLLVGRGEMEASEVEQALAGGKLPTHETAPPEGLVLWRVGLSADWIPLGEAHAIGRRRLARDRATARQRSFALEAAAGPPWTATRSPRRRA